MNMNDVRRALEICRKPTCSCRDNNGVKCPYSEKVVCVDNLCNDAAEMIDTLTADRDEWKQRAEAAEKALQEMQARVEQVEIVRTFETGMSDDFRMYLKRWILDDISRLLQEKNLIQFTEKQIGEWDSEMRGTVLVLRPVKEDER